MPLPVEPKVEFLVCYKANPHYDGTFNAKLKPGIHGTFNSLAEAKEGVEKCKEWFQKESVNTPKNVNGKLVDDIKITMHQNVIVWIDEYSDGVFVEPQKSGKEKAAA